MTLIEEARKGQTSEFVKKCAEAEGLEVEKLLKLISKGYVVIPKN
ncbi:MAG: phosphomethylpyrimidine synthase ThiC, partial [Archaeoglobaceae archaeon]